MSTIFDRVLQTARRPAARVAPLAVAALAGCADSSPRGVFEQEVVPLLERGCASTQCHGVAEGAEAAGEVIDWTRLYVRVGADGRISDLEQAYEVTKLQINTEEDPTFSMLLRKPLDEAYGGIAHYGGAWFTSDQDPAFRAIRDWIAAESGGGERPEPLTDLEQQFGDEVLPALISMSCLNGNCHGAGAAIPYRLDPGVPAGFSIANVRTNYEASRNMLALNGDPDQARLLRKALPLHDGGIAHKGGNSAFLPNAEDRRADAIRAWACAERLEATGVACLGEGEAAFSSFVFVRGEVTAHDPFDLDEYAPGTDIWLATAVGGSWESPDLVNLTAALHDGSGDARDPAIDATGTRLAFALRTSADTGHDLYEMDLGTREVRRLTTGSGPLPGGGLATDRHPTWGPDGHVWFVSTRDGKVADQGRLLDSDLYETDPATGALTRRSWTPHIERKPVFYANGEETAGTIAFTSLRDAVPEQVVAHPFRFPPGLRTEYHQHFGVTLLENLLDDARETADGRYVTVAGDLGNVWEGGRLGICDRNFGPELNEDAPYPEPGLPFYAPPFARLDPEAAHQGVTGGLYRDPAPLPDGAILSAYAPGPLDLGDPAAVVDLGIVMVTIDEAVDASGPVMSSRTVLIDEPGVSEYDPEPVLVTAAPRLGAPTWDPLEGTAMLLHQGVELIDALIANLPPSGPKETVEGVKYMRLVEAIPQTLAERAPVPPEETRYGIEGATAASLSVHGPSRVLAELEVEEDGSFQAEVPAGTALRMQMLDETGMTVGLTHNRWFDFHPGQTLKIGLSKQDPAFYGTKCAACHGALDGDPGHAFIEPDVMTMASATLARFEDKDPRRPRVAPLCGPGTRIDVDFRADVQPVLDRACVSCHEGEAAGGGLTLTGEATTHYTDAYESLLKPGSGSVGGHEYVDAGNGRASGSFLIEKLSGVELDAPKEVQNAGRPHPVDEGGEALATADLQTLIRWIELGATYVGGTEEGE